MTVHTAGNQTHGNVYQASYNRLREVLHSAVTHAAHTSSDDGVGSLTWRMGAALDSLLAAHPVDRRGRCRSCRSPRFWRRRRRVCMVFQQAHYWLRQPADQLLGHLAGTLEGHYAFDALRTPAVSSPLPPRRVPQTGRPDPDHGGAGMRTPDCSQPRRVPSEDPDESLLLTGERVSWPG